MLASITISRAVAPKQRQEREFSALRIDARAFLHSMATPGGATAPPDTTEAQLAQLTRAVALLTEAVAKGDRQNQLLREEAARREADTERRETARRKLTELSKYKLPHETDEEAVVRCESTGIYWQGYFLPPATAHFLVPYGVSGYDTSATGPYKFNLFGSSFRYGEAQWYLKLKERDRLAEADALAGDCTLAVHLRAMHRHLEAVGHSLSALLAANPAADGESTGATALREGAIDLSAALTEAANSAFYNAKCVEMRAAANIAIAENNPGASVLRALMSSDLQNVTQEATLRRMLTTFENSVKHSLNKQMAAAEAASQKRAAELRAAFREGQAAVRKEKAEAGFHQRNQGGNGGRGGNGKGGANKGAPAAADRS